MPDLQNTEINTPLENRSTPNPPQQLDPPSRSGSPRLMESRSEDGSIRSSENLDLTRLVPYDESIIYQKVDQHIGKIQKEFEALVEEMSGSMNEVFSLLALHLDNQMRGLNEGCSLALEEIRASERKQEEIREQLLSFINMLRTAYSQFFQND